MNALTLLAIEGIGEVPEGTDLSTLFAGVELHHGDIVLVTSKVVSKAEGQVRAGARDDALADETVRVVAHRGPVCIVENHLGLVMAAAGIDASNVETGRLVLLPRDPDASAATLRARLMASHGVNVGVVITDTAGRPWRLGQTDIAIGMAGVMALESFAGRRDSYGNELAVTAPAVADELAGAAELASGKLGGRPIVVARGLARLVLPVNDDGPGAKALQRPRGTDLFALGVRESVIAAVAGHDRDSFGPAAPTEEFLAALVTAGLAHGVRREDDSTTLVVDDAAAAETRALVAVVAVAHGWSLDDSNRLRPTP